MTAAVTTAAAGGDLKAQFALEIATENLRHDKVSGWMKRAMEQKEQKASNEEND